ncbi:hypothetical protein ILYODFUR_013850 [Ilyodon furcidens]|uniref:Uncharacterized protein n=1 Tax=Ilyodon furcidens TaxID=33524 RepID=A0ABV0T0I4_9TELE
MRDVNASPEESEVCGLTSVIDQEMLKHADLLVAEVRKRSMHVVLESSTTLRVCCNCPDLHSGRAPSFQTRSESTLYLCT